MLETSADAKATSRTWPRVDADLARRLALPAIVIAYAAVFLNSIWDMSIIASIWPRIVLIALIVLQLILAVREIRAWAGERRTAGDSASNDDVAIAAGGDNPVGGGSKRLWLRSVYTAVVMGLYIYAVPRFGYYTCSGIFVVVAMLLLGVRNIFALVICVVGWLAFSYLILAQLLQLILPSGVFY
jgi:hypothetical protein